MATTALAALQETPVPQPQSQALAPPQAQQAPQGPTQQVPAGPPPEAQADPNAQAPPEKDPKKAAGKVDHYVTVLMNELHGPETRDEVLDILKSSDDPYITIPQAALAVNDMAAMKVQQAGGRLDLNTQFQASQYLVSDLMEIGNAFGLFKVDQKDFGDLLEDSLQGYIERGLEDGSIDPIELQLTAEGFMTQNQKVGGHYLAQEHGMPYEPQQQQVIAQVERSTARRVKSEESARQAQMAKQQQDEMIRMQQQGGN